MEFGTTTSHGLGIKTGNTRRLTITSAGNATFTGTISSGAITSTGAIVSGDNIVIGSGGTYQAGNIYSDSSWGMILRAKQNNPTQADFLFSDYADNHLVRFDGSYGLRIQQGGLQIGTVAVIDASRNLTNIGTISSGAITAESNGNNQIHLKGTDTNPTAILMDYNGTGSTDRVRIYNNAGGFQFLTENGNEKLSIAKTTGNATFAGTISSGGITATDTYGGGSGDYTNITTPQLKIVAEGSSYFRIPHISGSSTISGVYNYEDTKDVYWGEPNDSGTYHFRGRTLNISDSELAINGTTVINSSRNLTNIGTITASGDITTADRIISKESSGGFYKLHTDGTFRAAFYDDNGNTQIYADGDGSNPFITLSGGATHKTDIDGVLNLSGTNRAIKMNDTTIVDISRNLTNIGTISSGAITSTGNVTAYSDERLKTNIQTLDGKKALQMRGVSFIKDGEEGSGVIAQEIEEIAPELVLTADDEMGTKSVAYGNLVGYLIEAIKDQQQQIDELKAKIENGSS